MTNHQNDVQYQAQLQRLIAKGEHLLDKFEQEPPRKYYAWYEKAKIALMPFHFSDDDFARLDTPSPDNIHRIIGKLEATKSYIDKQLHNIFFDIKNEVPQDLAAQAQQLLDEDKSDMVVAAFSAGIALEIFLRNYLTLNHPDIDLKHPNGRLKTLGMLVGEIGKRSIFDRKQSQLECWVQLRNDAAHGHENELNLHEVESMVNGIAEFIAEYK